MWNDLTLKQALTVLNYTSLDVEGQKITIETRLVWIADYISGGFIAKITEREGDEDIRLEELKQLVEEYAHPFFDITGGQSIDDPKIIQLSKPKYSIKLGLTKSLYPILESIEKRKKNDKRRKMKKHRYHAPKDALSNVTIYELSWIFSLLEAFASTGDEQVLSNLLAVVYRPSKPKTKENQAAGYHGDRRRALLKEESMIEERAVLMHSLPREVRNLLYFWLASCRQHIVESYPIIFDTENPTIEKDEKAKDYGWGGLLLSIAEGVVDLDTVAQQNYQNVFLWLAKLEDDRRMELLRAKTS